MVDSLKMAETFLAHMKTTEGTVEALRKGGLGNGAKCRKCKKPLGNRRNRSGARKRSFTELCRSCNGKKQAKIINEKRKNAEL